MKRAERTEDLSSAVPVRWRAPAIAAVGCGLLIGACGATETSVVTSTVTSVSSGRTITSTSTGTTTIVRTLVDVIIQAGPPILKVQTSPGAVCRPTAFDSAGHHLTVSWLTPRQADGSGVLEWDAPNSSASSSGPEASITGFIVVCSVQGTSLTTSTTLG